MTDKDERSVMRGLTGSEILLFLGMDAAVVTIGEAHSGRSRTAPVRSQWTVMERYTGLIRSRTPIRVRRMHMTMNNAGVIAGQIVSLAPRVSISFVTGLSAQESALVKREVVARGGPLVLAELDTVTAALAAATISLLRGQGAAPRSGRVVVNGPEIAPLLGPILMNSGIGQITNWHGGDAHAFPLRRLMEKNDVLIDLAGTASESDAPGRIVRYPADPFTLGQLVVPGLLSALCGHEAREVTIEVLAAAARALALTTPTGQALPGPDDGLVTRAIARQVGRVFAQTTDPSKHP